MKTQNTAVPSVPVLRPRQLLAGADADTLATQIIELAHKGSVDVVLDCTSVGFIDSHGLEVLVDAAERLIRDGRTLKLAGLNPTLREVLDLTELASLFELHETVASATGSAT